MSTSHTSQSGGFIPLDTIMDTGRVLRNPISDWAKRLTPMIRSCSGEISFAKVQEGCAALNNAALVFVHAGMPEYSKEICHSQMDWLASFRTLFSDSQLSELAIHPWVNLGRLSRRSRNYDEALGYFLALDVSCHDSIVQFEQWSVPVSPSLRITAEPIYVYEILRTHMQSGDWIRALDFAINLKQPISSSTSMLVTELMVHSFLHQGDVHEVVPVMKQMPWPGDSFGILAKCFYSAIFLSAIGQRESCVKAIHRMKPHLTSYLGRQELDSRDLRLSIELCRLASYLDLPEFLESMLSTASAIVLHARDVPFASQLITLSKQALSIESFDGVAALEGFVASSGYRLPWLGSTEPGISEALRDLRSAVSELLCVPVSR